MSSEFRQNMIRHWQSFKNPLINDVLTNMEKIEADFPKLSEAEEQKIQDLLDALKNIDANKIDEMQMITTMNRLPAAYMLYIIHQLQTINDQVIMKLINYAQANKADDPMIAKFYQRNMCFEKSQLLGRIFSDERMQNVLEVLI